MTVVVAAENTQELRIWSGRPSTRHSCGMPGRRKGARDKTKAQANLRRTLNDAPGRGPGETGQGPPGLSLDLPPGSTQGLINGLSFLAAVTIGDFLRSPGHLAQLAAGRGVTVAEYAAELQDMIEDDSADGQLLLAGMGAAQLVRAARATPEEFRLFVENLAAATGLSKPATAAAIRAYARRFKAAAATPGA